LAPATFNPQHGSGRHRACRPRRPCASLRWDAARARAASAWRCDRIP